MVREINLINTDEDIIDEIGQRIEVKTVTPVFAVIDSITQSEFLSGGQLGLQPDLRFRVWAHEYNGQKMLEYDNAVYSVYRTYQAPDGRTELYTEMRIGENDS